MKTIISLCSGTGAWERPYKDAGYTVVSITLPEFNVLETRFSKDEILFYSHRLHTDVKVKNVYGILAAPPCTMFSLAWTTAKTPRDFEGAMEVVSACLRIIWTARANHGLKFWALENPTAYLRQFLGKPAMKFQPYEFGDRYKKSTDLWGYFNEPKKSLVVLTEKEIRDSRVNTRPLPKIKGLTVAARRAITPAGFAQAFYKANL